MAIRARPTATPRVSATLYRTIFTEWVRQCPQAVSPRCANDEDFRARMITYLVESAVSKDLDPTQQPLEAEMQIRANSLVRVPMGDNAWRVENGFWEYAELFKKQVELAYAHMAETGVLALDPDEAPAGVPVRMEYSTFCQGWISHLSAGGRREAARDVWPERQLRARTRRSTPRSRSAVPAAQHLKTVPGATAVICDGCGRKLDLGGGMTPCQGCGAALSFPVGVNQLNCPYCSMNTART